MACGLSIVVVGLANFGSYIVHQLINLFYKKRNLYNHKKNLERGKQSHKYDENVNF
jgi:hypothetical protein